MEYIEMEEEHLSQINDCLSKSRNSLLSDKEFSFIKALKNQRNATVKQLDWLNMLWEHVTKNG